MATPIVRRNTSQSSQSNEPETAKTLPLNTRRLAAWVTEITLVVVSGLVPFGLGVYANSRSDLNRVPLHPVLVVTERAIARPLALPVSYGIRNVAAPTNFLWLIALLAPVTLSWWQLYLLGKTGSTIPKRKFGVRVVNEVGKPPGLAAVVAREGIGRWSVPVSIAYILWRYSFAFPNLGLFTFLAVLMVLGEGIALPSRRGRRPFHDWLAGTYTIDATPPLASSDQDNKSQVPQSGEELAPVSMSTLTGETTNTSTLWRRMRQNPNRTLFAVAVTSMIAVLGTLVATQVYIQTQQTRRETKQINSQKFLVLVERLSPNSGATTEERQSIILAMGGLNDPQSIQFLTDLLVQETNPILLNTIQQALVSVGVPAIPELKNKNQLLAGELKSVGSKRELRQQQLRMNQQTINKILSVYSTQNAGIDLSRAELGQSSTSQNSFFNLVLDNVDLSGINLKSANLQQGSFKGSIFRGVGDDGRWDTFDDAIADLSQAQMKQANFTDANLSRVIMNRSDLNGATLNRANLSHARLIGADLSSTQLVGANLRGAFLEKASLTGADIGEAKFNEANLYGARLSRVIAIGTHLSYANLTNSDWRGADLSGAYLDRANLSNANLSATRLTGAVLRSARLENTNLQNADLSFVDLRGANVAGADFQGTVLAPVPQNPAERFVEMPDLGEISAVVQGVDFSQAKNLDSRQIAYICTQGGLHSSCP
ncbi:MULTISPECIES: pentapeptide repeat-containing protein [Cyanophyceae]|uniref:Low-complexity protein n=1 Tax=Nodularia spumigena CENA596 TaxID=1819295 RepID=A0A161XL66_NODSP|nr:MULTISPECIES: pentapeptide repeat-containing protein [Cyanophyceae]KZL50511.1 low-complexity protein [Nodularia spumigena CENA596]MDB9316085.1 pentapeptide repeat-containing protein [Nodularia spumigena CS-590/01A]MDB9324314.1 pentapeptide repeat-containing protein [Nodularia spumigena CS-591/07A]MDB9327481.1 pentapeptide repeat-containing protein [Nodularia spumigena CS-590/02]MDB9329863.1 pentapeptide repeat-containing protein [Nodularia spumigena CS-591/04]